MNTRLAVAVEENGAGDKVAEHFGSCAKFTVSEIDSEKKIIKTESYFNPLVGDHGGVCQLPGYLKQFNVNVIIAGGMGNRAISNFEKFGIEVITAPGLLYNDAVDLYLQGNLKGFSACKHEHGHEHAHGHQHAHGKDHSH